MICLTCLHSVSQTFTNGEITSSILFCKVLMRDVKGNLVKCGGYEIKTVPVRGLPPFPGVEGEVVMEPITKFPKLVEQLCQESVVDCKEPEIVADSSLPKDTIVFKQGDKEVGRIVNVKPLTQSERMKEYWRNRKGKKG
jgi:hypothetical protein